MVRFTFPWRQRGKHKVKRPGTKAKGLAGDAKDRKGWVKASLNDKIHLKDIIMSRIICQDDKYLPRFTCLSHTELETDIFNANWELKPEWTYLKEAGVSAPEIAFSSGYRVITETDLAREAKKKRRFAKPWTREILRPHPGIEPTILKNDMSVKRLQHILTSEIEDSAGSQRSPFFKLRLYTELEKEIFNPNWEIKQGWFYERKERVSQFCTIGRVITGRELAAAAMEAHGYVAPWGWIV